MSITAAWGNRIRERREELGLTVDDAAAKLDVDRATWYRWEAGSFKRLEPATQIAIAAALEIDPDRLFTLKACA